MGRISTSGYCLTCRQRRVKCDRGTPSCQRCIKSGHRCKGYEGLVIRMDKWCPPSATLAERATPLVRSPSLLRVTSWSAGGPVGRHTRESAAAAASRTTLAMPWGAAAIEHWMSHFQWAPWWKFVFQLGLRTDSSGAAYKAASSLVTGYYAQHKGDNKIFLESRRYYGESLALVSQALTFHTRDSLKMMVLPIMILSMHPYMFDRSVEFEHHVGLGIIMQNCGPVAFQHMAGIFRSCRSVIVCQAFARRERSFLEEPQWRDTPFLLGSKTHMDHLYDIIVHVPGLFEDIHAMRAGQVRNDYAYMAREECILRQQLDDWLATWQAAGPCGAYATPESRSPASDTSIPEHSSQDDFRVEYGTLDRAMEALAYYTTALYLDKLADLIAAGPTPHSNPTIQPRAPSPMLVAMVRLAEWLALEMSKVNVQQLSTPLPIAIIFCVLKDLGGPGDELASGLAKTCREKEPQHFEVYETWKPAPWKAPALEDDGTTFCRGDH